MFDFEAMEAGDAAALRATPHSSEAPPAAAPAPGAAPGPATPTVDELAGPTVPDDSSDDELPSLIPLQQTGPDMRNVTQPEVLSNVCQVQHSSDTPATHLSTPVAPTVDNSSQATMTEAVRQQLLADMQAHGEVEDFDITMGDTATPPPPARTQLDPGTILDDEARGAMGDAALVSDTFSFVSSMDFKPTGKVAGSSRPAVIAYVKIPQSPHIQR